MTRAILLLTLLGCGPMANETDGGAVAGDGSVSARPVGCDAWDWEYSHCMTAYPYAKDSCIVRANQAATPLQCCQFNKACSG